MSIVVKPLFITGQHMAFQLASSQRDAPHCCWCCACLTGLYKSVFLISCSYKIQHFNAVASQTSGSLLLLSAISIIIPTAAQQLGTGGGGPDTTGLLGMLGAGMQEDKVRLGPVGQPVWFVTECYLTEGVHIF